MDVINLHKRKHQGKSKKPECSSVGEHAFRLDHPIPPSLDLYLDLAGRGELM